MKSLRYLSLGVLAALTFFVTVGLSLPARFSVSERVEIAAPPHLAFRAVNSLPEWEYWYVEEVEGFEQRFAGPAEGVGALFLWEGEGREGRLEIVASEPVERVEMRLLAQNASWEARVAFGFEPMDEGERVAVTLAQSGGFGWNLLLRAQAYFFDYPEQLRTEYKAKLAALKRYCEAQDPAEIPMRLETPSEAEEGG